MTVLVSCHCDIVQYPYSTVPKALIYYLPIEWEPKNERVGREPLAVGPLSRSRGEQLKDDLGSRVNKNDSVTGPAGTGKESCVDL